MKDRIAAKESEDSAKEIKTLKENIDRFEEGIIGRIPLQGAKHFLWDALIKEISPLGKHLVMLDEWKQASMAVSKRCKSLQEILVRMPREEAQKEIIVLNATTREEPIALGVADRITLLVTTRRMTIKHNLLQSALARIDIMHQGLEKFNKLFQPLFQKGFP